MGTQLILKWARRVFAFVFRLYLPPLGYCTSSLKHGRCVLRYISLHLPAKQEQNLIFERGIYPIDVRRCVTLCNQTAHLSYRKAFFTNAVKPLKIVTCPMTYYADLRCFELTKYISMLVTRKRSKKNTW